MPDVHTVSDASKPARARDIVDTATRTRIAALSGADPRTVDRVLLGLPVRGDVRLRVLAVLAEAGIEPISPPGGAP